MEGVKDGESVYVYVSVVLFAGKLYCMNSVFTAGLELGV